MRTDGFLLLVGLLLIALPYIGVPDSWKWVLVVVLGISLVCTSLLVRHRRTVVKGSTGENAIAMENPAHPEHERYE